MSIACSRVVSPFELHYRLNHPFLSVEEVISLIFKSILIELSRVNMLSFIVYI